MSQQPSPLLNVTTAQLQYLVAMSQSESLAEAAASQGVTPSALSQALTDLERRVGLDLFERKGRSRQLTAQGREMVDLARGVLAATRDLTIWSTQSGSGQLGIVRLGMIDIAAVGYFPDVLLGFRSARPDVELQLSVASSAPLLDQLAAGSLDAAVVVEPPSMGHDTTPYLPDHPDLTATELLMEDLAVYAPPDIVPSDHRTPTRWGPWVTFPSTSHSRRHIAAAIRSLGAEFQVAAESHQPDVLRQMVRLGMGWTVLPVLQAETDPRPLQRAWAQPLLSRRLLLAHRRASRLNPATQVLLGEIQAAANRWPN